MQNAKLYITSYCFISENAAVSRTSLTHLMYQKKKKNPSGIIMCAFRKLKGINFTAPSISCHHQIGFFSLQYVTHIDCLDNDLHEPLQEEERGELKVTIKVFLCSKLPPQVIHESVEKGIASGPHPISIFEKVLVTKYY